MSDFFEEGWGFAVGLFLAAVVLTISTMGMIKLGEKMFPGNGRPSLTQQSLDMCRAAHGTPVLEAEGQAYKSCAINGKSQTGNYVSHEQ